MQALEDAELLDLLQLPEDHTEFKRAVRILFDTYKDRIIALIRNIHPLQEADLNDILNQSFSAFLHNVRSGKFKGESSIYTYLGGIAKIMLHSFKREKEKEKLLLQRVIARAREDVAFSPESIYLRKELQIQVQKLLQQLGEPCFTVLRLWSKNYKFEEIAERTGLKSPDVARVTKLRCIKKLGKLIKEHPELLN